MWLPCCVIVGTTAVSVSALNIAKSKPTKRIPNNMCIDNHLTENVEKLLTNDFRRRLTAPAIFSKQQLFGNSNNEVQPDNFDMDSDEDIGADTMKRIKGINKCS